MSDTGHVPGQVDDEFADDPVEEEKAPEAPAPEKEKGEESKDEKPTEEKKPEAEAPKDETPPEQPKKRSIYDDLKDKKREVKDATARAEAAEARASELETLLADKDKATTPQEKSEAKDAIDEWAEKQGLDGKAVRELTEIIKGALPKPDGGVLTAEEAAEWRAERARAKAAAEDQAVLAEAPSVRKQLEELGTVVHDDAEFQALMNEVVKLSHTKEFHDKDVGYIVWSKREQLKHMITPKKKSFEHGGQRGESKGDAEPDFTGGKVSPMDAQRAVEGGGRTSGYEIRSGRK